MEGFLFGQENLSANNQRSFIKGMLYVIPLFGRLWTNQVLFGSKTVFFGKTYKLSSFFDFFHILF